MIHGLSSASRSTPIEPADAPTQPPPSGAGPAAHASLRSRGDPGTAASAVPAPRQPAPTALLDLPKEMLREVAAHVAKPDLDRPLEAARHLARLGRVDPGFRHGVADVLRGLPDVSRAASAARLTQAADEALRAMASMPADMPHAEKLAQAREGMAAALRNLSHLVVDIGQIRSPEVAALVVDVLATHPDLRSLEIAAPANFHALNPLMDLLAARPGVVRRLDLQAGPDFEAPAPGLDRAQVTRVLMAQKDSLTSLNLSNTRLGMDADLAGAIGSLTHLQRLDLAGAGLEAGQGQILADAVRPLRALQELDAGHNRLSLEDCTGLVAALSGHPELCRLSLRANQIGSAEGLDPIQRLPRLAQWADALRSLRTLQHLDLGHNQLDVAACGQVAGALTDHAHLRHLDLGTNLLGDTGAQQLVPCLASLVRLESLDLSNNDIGVEGSRQVAAQLVLLHKRQARAGPKAAGRLRHLSLAGNSLGDEAAPHLGRALKEIPILQELNLERCQIGPAGMGDLAPALRRMTGLRTLSLEGNHLDREGYAPLLDALAQMRDLRDLNLARTTVRRDGACMKELAPVLGCLPRLHALNLGGNDLDQEGCEALAAALHQTPGLRALNLMCMTDGEELLPLLGSSLTRMTGLQHLNLRGNWAIVTDSSTALFTVLKKLPNLSTLDLGGSLSLCDKWEQFAEAVGACARLRELHLSDTSLGLRQVRCLAPQLARLHHLEVLDLSRIALGERALRELMPVLSKLRLLRMSDDAIDGNYLTALRQALPQTRIVTD